MMKTMHFIAGILAFSAICDASAQSSKGSFTIHGSLVGSHVDSVILQYPNASGAYTRVAKPVVGNHFLVQGAISMPTEAVLQFKNKGEVISMEQQEKRSRFFYIAPGSTSISGEASDLPGLKITGSKAEEEFESLNANLQPVKDEMKPLEEAFYKEKDHEKAAAIHDKFAPFQDRMKKITYQFFIDHPTSAVTLNEMSFYSDAMGMDSVKRVYNGLTSSQKNSASGKQIHKTMQAYEASMPGSTAFVFSRTDMNGKPLSLSDFRGKYVIVDFWASWCVPCRKSNPHMKELYQKYKDKGLDVIGVADDDGHLDAWHKAVEQDGVGIWHNVLRGFDLKKLEKHIPNPNDLDDKYGVHSIPVKFLIDPNGKIVGRYGDDWGKDEAALDKKLEEIYKY